MKGALKKREETGSRYYFGWYKWLSDFTLGYTF